MSLCYLLALRISEALRLKKSQFIIGKNEVKVVGIELSKSRVKGKLRQDQYRQECALPRIGERAVFTTFILTYLQTLKDEETSLFKFKRDRAFKIINALTGAPCHWFRAYGETYLYQLWDHDLLAVADYVKVDAQTLAKYIRRGYEKYRIG